MERNQMSPILMAYFNGIKDEIELLRIGIFSLIQKEYINVENIQEHLIYSVNKKRSGIWISEEENLILEGMEQNKENILSNNKRIYRLSKYILEIMKEEIIHLKKIKSELYFLLGFLAIIFFTSSFWFGIKTNNENLLLSLVSLILFGASFSLGFLIFKIAISKFAMIIGKLILIIILSFFFIQISLVWVLFVVNMKWWNIIYIPFFALIWICYKNRVKYTEKGKKFLDEMNLIKTNLCQSVKSGEIPKFETEDELIEYFKEFLPLSLSLKLEKITLIYLEKTIENSNLNKNEIFEKLNILAYIDKKIYKQLFICYSNSPEYRIRGDSLEVITRKGKRELWN